MPKYNKAFDLVSKFRSAYQRKDFGGGQVAAADALLRKIEGKDESTIYLVNKGYNPTYFNQGYSTTSLDFDEDNASTISFDEEDGSATYNRNFEPQDGKPSFIEKLDKHMDTSLLSDEQLFAYHAAYLYIEKNSTAYDPKASPMEQVIVSIQEDLEAQALADIQKALAGERFAEVTTKKTIDYNKWQYEKDYNEVDKNEDNFETTAREKTIERRAVDHILRALQYGDLGDKKSRIYALQALAAYTKDPSADNAERLNTALVSVSNTTSYTQKYGKGLAISVVGSGCILSGMAMAPICPPLAVAMITLGALLSAAGMAYNAWQYYASSRMLSSGKTLNSDADLQEQCENTFSAICNSVSKWSREAGSYAYAHAAQGMTAVGSTITSNVKAASSFISNAVKGGKEDEDFDLGTSDSFSNVK